MVHIGIPASMSCDEQGCTESTQAMLVLLGTGGFGFKPADKTWQVMLPGGVAGAASPFTSRCPKHKTMLQVGPAGPRVVKANGH